jgi:hypothetical protein
MRLSLRVWLFLSLGMFVGCESTSGLPAAVEYPDDFPPHGGIRVSIGGGKGYMEVVAKKGDSPSTGEISVYFYGNDFAPYHPAPDSAVLWLDAKQKVTLESNGEDALVTPTGNALLGNRSVIGMMVSVELDGEQKNIRVVPAER